eukprot:CAMPEP_0174734768 /NCGR_PEP_ID=MMETSP1094-20130205/63885_1 /TAXON_ID=156173 /ORGANISM="Chrysochromulina brevifilum, Strain UTEX LB 985" /LENGTH=78 /DNA_ID=CAMNT_0015937637 /DNA_START=105 /DNA_END=341 /DNA_ORIENTATION=+
MVKGSKKKSMKVDASEGFTYGATGAGTKKKRVVKLSKKQMKRKASARERGAGIADRRSKKLQNDQRKFDRVQIAKQLW